MNIQRIIIIAKKNSTLYWIGKRVKDLYEKLHPVRGNGNIINVQKSIVNIKKTIVGNDNVVEINNATIIEGTIRIRGNGNHLVIEEGCHIGKECSFWLEGNNNTIIIGKNTTMTSCCHLNAQEHNTTIIVGEDCMFSNTIIVRTSDSHPIFNDKGERINPAKDVVIGKHVWIAPNSVIMKGAIIGNGCIIGSHSIVNKTIPSSCLAVGMPAKVVKEKISWTREYVLC